MRKETCQHPVCEETVAETVYDINPSPPPPLVAISLCEGHLGLMPTEQDERGRWFTGLRNLIYGF